MNRKKYTKKAYKLKIYRLKLFQNVRNNAPFYLNKINKFQKNLYDKNAEMTFYSTFLSDPLSIKFYSTRYQAIENYITSMEIINYNYLKGQFILKSKYSMLTYFIPFLIKNGKKLHTINNVLNAISKIYLNLNLNTSNFYNTYSYVTQFKHHISKNNESYNLNHLLYWIINIYKPVFDIKCFNTPKIHKKKSGKSIMFKIVYLSDKNRLKTAYKHISTNIKKDHSNNFDTRITNIFLDTLLNYKKSYLYTRKMYIYEQVMDL